MNDLDLDLDAEQSAGTSSRNHQDHFRDVVDRMLADAIADQASPTILRHLRRAAAAARQL